ncbi:MAG: hypothetical protein JXA18_13665 [Chitinispirillaceae bacterium]|nr:hypothetical protein [Chitinispirillaceae bacterium]
MKNETSLFITRVLPFMVLLAPLSKGADIPPYRGTRYIDSVPQTLDLAEMAGLAINGLTGPIDPDDDYSLYFQADWFRRPPVLRHEEGSDECLSKFMGALVFNRLISGSDLHLTTERNMIDRYLEDTDGLVLHTSGSSSRILEAFMLYYLRDGKPLWREYVEQAVRNMIDKMVDMGDWAYFGTSDRVPTGFGALDGWRAEALALAYGILGYAPAGKWGAKYISYLKNHAEAFNAQGHFIGDVREMGQRAEHGGHFHNHTCALIAFLEYAQIAGDTGLVAFVRQSYEWAKHEERGSSSLIGFFPEFVGKSYPNGEGCPIADMIVLALKLSAENSYDYWDDADRWLRNHFVESQLTVAKGDQMERMARSMDRVDIAAYENADRVTERNIGAFAGWPGVNEWAHHIGIQHCCTGNCARAIYLAWEDILHYNSGVLKINLLLNRSSPWADVYSEIPYRGRVEIKVKRQCDSVLLRVPEWVEIGSDSVKCTVNGQQRGFIWRGRYMSIGVANANDTAVFTFPIRKREVTETIAGINYIFTIKGNTVLEVDPPGSNCPLYNRTHYQNDRAPKKVVERFVSDERIPFYSKSKSNTTRRVSDRAGFDAAKQEITVSIHGDPLHWYAVISGPVSDEGTDISGTVYDMSGRVVSHLLSPSTMTVGRGFRTCRLDLSCRGRLSPGIFVVRVCMRKKFIQERLCIPTGR